MCHACDHLSEVAGLVQGREKGELMGRPNLKRERRKRKKKKLAGSCARLENGLRIVAPKPAGLMQFGRA